MIDFTKYKTEKELQEFCKTLYSMNLLLQNKVNSITEKLEHCEKMLKDSVTEFKEGNVENLLLREIEYIDKLSQAGGLNLEETKQLKLLVDGYINLIKKNEKPEAKPKKLPGDPSKLISIVKKAKNEE